MWRKYFSLILIVLAFALFSLAYSVSVVYAQTATETPEGLSTLTVTATLDPDLVIVPQRAYAVDVCLAMAFPATATATPEGVTSSLDLGGIEFADVPDMVQGVVYPVLFVILQGEDEVLQLENGLTVLAAEVLLTGDCDDLVRLEIEAEDNAEVDEKKLADIAKEKQELVWDLQDVEDLLWGLGESDVDEDTGRLDPAVADTLSEWLLYSIDEEAFTPALIEVFEAMVLEVSDSGEMPEGVERALVHYMIEHVNLELDSLIWYGFDAELQRYASDVYGGDAPEVLVQLTEIVETEVESEENEGEVEIVEEEVLVFVEGWIVNDTRFQLLEQPREFFAGRAVGLNWVSDVVFDDLEKPYLMDESFQFAVMSEYFEDAAGYVYWIESVQDSLGYAVFVMRAGWDGDEIIVDTGGYFVLPLDLHNVSYTLGYMDEQGLVIEICAEAWCVVGEVLFESFEEETE